MEYLWQSNEWPAISILVNLSGFSQVRLTTHRRLTGLLTGTRVAHGGEEVERPKVGKEGLETTETSFVTSKTALSRKALWGKTNGSDPLYISLHII